MSDDLRQAYEDLRALSELLVEAEVLEPEHAIPVEAYENDPFMVVIKGKTRNLVVDMKPSLGYNLRGKF